MRLGAPDARLGDAGWQVHQTGSLEGPILVDSNVDTDDDSGEFGGEPDGHLTVWPASTPSSIRRHTLPLHRARTTWMDVSISPRAGLGCHKATS